MRMPRIPRWAVALAAPAMAMSLISAPAAAAEEAPEAQIVDITPMVMAALDQEGGSSVDASPVAAAADLYEAGPRNAFNVSTANQAKISGGITLQVRQGLVTRDARNDVPIAWARVVGAESGDSLAVIVRNGSGGRVADDGTRSDGTTTYTNGFQIRSGYKYTACLSDTAVGCDHTVSKTM